MVQVGTGTVALWEACIEKFNPEVTTEIGSLTKTHGKKWAHQYISHSARAQREACPHTWLTVPSSLIAESTAPTLFPAPSVLTGPCTQCLFLRIQYLKDHSAESTYLQLSKYHLIFKIQ